MNRNLLDNLEHETPLVKVENSGKKQGRGVLGLVFLAVFGVFFIGQVKAQEDFSGYYFIANSNGYVENSSNNYYLAPASNGGNVTLDIRSWAWNSDEGTPFMTTNKTSQCPKTLWVIEKTGNYYYISTTHNSVKKYAVFRRVFTDGDSHRKTMHLEAISSPVTTDSAMFQITKRDNGYFNIRPKDLPTGWGNSNLYWTPSGGNKDETYGTGSCPKCYGGLIGLYKEPGNAGQQWVFEDASAKKPTISYDVTTTKVTIESATTDATIYYTLTGADPVVPTAGNPPTSPTQLYNPNSKPTVDSRTVVKAIAVKTGLINSAIATTTIVTNPTFELAAGPYIYNRSAQEPSVNVKDEYGDPDVIVVIDPAEYTVSYANNINATTSTSLATITITDNDGGNYIVNGSTTFTIEPMSIGDGGNPVSGITITVGSSGNGHTVTVKHGSATLTEGTNNDYTWVEGPGSDEVTVTGHNNYTGTAIGHYVSVTPGYYALHKDGVGYLKRYSDNVTLGNDGTFRYGNSFDNGSSIWIVTPQGYLQSDYYYLNVANGRTLYLSVTPQTQWKTDEISGNEHGKKQLKTTIGGVDYYLCNNNGIKLTTNQSIAYNACPINLTELSWSEPTVNNITVRSPQQITYLRNCYFKQTIHYSFDNDAGTSVTDNTEAGVERRVFVRLTYVSTTNTTSLNDKGTKWDIDQTDGIIYHIYRTENSQNTSNYTVTANYNLLPADYFALESHPSPVEKEIKFTLEPRPIAPTASPSTPNYLLYSIFGGNNFRYPYDNGLSEGAPVKPDGKGGLGSDSKLADPDLNNGIADISWKVEMDAMGFYSFKNSLTGKYLYFDESDYTYSDYGTLKVGSDSPSTSDTRYKFRFFKTTNSGGFGTCYYIIPYNKQFVVFKNDGLSASIYAALNSANYSNQTTPVISLHQPVDNSKWLIYKYEAEYRVRNDFVLSGPSATYNTTDDNIFSTEDCWYGKCIKASPTTGDLQRSMVISGSYNTTNLLNYVWTVDGLDEYVSTTGGTINADPTFNLDVTSLPVSAVTGTVQLQLQGGGGTYPIKTSGTKSLLFTIYGDASIQLTVISSLSQITSSTGRYKLTADNTYSSTNKPGPDATTFSGILDCDGHTIDNLTEPLFTTLTNGTVRNLKLKNVAISQPGNVGAIAGTANGASRIYNCGILPTDSLHISNNPSTVASSDNYNCGSLVGLLDGTARVINCFSYAWITKGGGGDYYVGGLVGNNSQISNQAELKTIVVNCMFYGDIDTINCSNFAPVYGNNAIKNDAVDGINPYCFFSEKDGTFSKKYLGTGYDINSYNRSWPVAEQYLTRFEYYRSILNSNRQLMAWWVSGNVNDTALISKWVLDPSIAPYPILKKWGKYPSIINPDPNRVWDTASGDWVLRTAASPYQGKKLGTLSVKVLPGSHAASGVPASKDTTLIITDMDTLNYDYCYYKVQLPYYNELFGNCNSTDHDIRYGGNYTDSVVTGWKITSVTRMNPDNDTVCFEGPWDATGRVRYRKNTKAWESGFNFADRKCTSKDLYVTSGRVFAQGGYYYVPDSVTAITIEAYWGKAIYMRNLGNNVDLVNLTNHPADGNIKEGKPFVPAGTLTPTFQGQTVFTDWRAAVKDGFTGVDAAGLSNTTVYDRAIVLVGNFQLRNENGPVGTDIPNLVGGSFRPYTIMSVDFDLDNEPDYCFELQFRREWGRPGIQPIRFDFLTVPELGMAVRHNENQNTIGIFIPQGHFEITETSYMHTTQFEYDFGGDKVESPVILNGGHFEQIVVRRGTNQRTSYFIMGGHFRMLRFTPGAHTTPDNSICTRHCAVNVIGGEYPEFYLSGIYKPEQSVNTDNPHCYTNGGRFGTIAGAGYEPIHGDVTFKIDHSIIDEFYGGGINAVQPVTGSIDVTIDHSIVGKYCGGPKVGVMTTGKTVTTHATETTFTKFYGGGNGGTSYYRKQGYDGNSFNIPNPSDSTGWAHFGTNAVGYTDYDRFNPLNTRTGTSPLVAVYDETKGYHALYEFECFVESNGLGEKPTIRTYTHWAQFGSTKTGNVTNVLNNCTIKENFYGGGNLGDVSGWVKSTLTDCTIMGNVFGGGFSNKIEPFRIHDKGQTHFPYIDKAGVMQNGLNSLNSLEYIDREYTWCYKNNSGQMFPQGVVIPSWANTSTGRNATFEYPEGSNKWYVLTEEPLENLGAVSGNITLTIEGKSTIGTYENGVLKKNTGNVFGGGDESAVGGGTVVKILDRTRVFGNIYGGGNRGKVTGDTKVIINGEVPETGNSATGGSGNNN